MSMLGQVKDYFKKGKKKKMSKEDKNANPTNLKVGIQTIKDYNKKRRKMLDEME